MLHILYHCLILWNIQYTHQQDLADDDADDDDDTDTCSFISGQNCDNKGICRYCAMCLQSSCILKSMPSNKTIVIPVCDTTQFGTTDVYDWYGYCLSSGNDNSGDYCATRTECYQYLRNSNTSTSYIWRNLTCDPNRCVLMTDNGQPAPTPGTLPPIDDPSASSNHNNPTHAISPHSAEAHNPTVIALSVTCTLIFVGVLVWFFRLWKQSGYWSPSCLKWIPATAYSSSTSARSLPHSAPPSFRSIAPEMTGIVATGTTDRLQQQLQRSSPSSSIRSLSNSSRYGEPLPSYFSPDPSPPKYEHAIVTQIRGLLEGSNYDYQPGASSSTSATMDHDDYDESMTMDYHYNALPPPMWVPIYFASNRTSFSLGRLRRNPQQHQPSSRNNVSTGEGRDFSSSSSTTEHDLGSSSLFYSASPSASQPQLNQHQQDRRSR